MFFPLAHAMPTFTGTSQDVADATAAWDAGVECTGIEPAAAGSVPILRDLAPADGSALAGLSSWGAPRGVRIRLLPQARSDVLAHEVAHAWLHTGELGALVEGRTQLLAACMQRRRPGRFDGLMDVGTELDRMPDLRTWSADPSQREDGEVAVQAYAGAFRLFRALALVAPPERLFAPGLDTWDALRAALPVSAEPALAAIDVGPEAQRAALLDEDLDGSSTLYERFAGTDARQWDTDGDGWWDGAPLPRPEGAIPLPRTGQPVCFPFIPEAGLSGNVEFGGQLAGLDVPPRTTVDSKPWGVVRWSSGWNAYPGGFWVRLVGEEYLPNPQCAVLEGLTVRSVEDMDPDELDTFASAVQRTMITLQAATGLKSDDTFITIKGKNFTIYTVSEEIQVPVLGPDSDSTARQVAAFALTDHLSGRARSVAAAALLRSVVPSAGYRLLDATPLEVAAWTRAAGRCATGWAGLIGGACAAP